MDRDKSVKLLNEAVADGVELFSLSVARWSGGRAAAVSITYDAPWGTHRDHHLATDAAIARGLRMDIEMVTWILWLVTPGRLSTISGNATACIETMVIPLRCRGHLRKATRPPAWHSGIGTEMVSWTSLWEITVHITAYTRTPIAARRSLCH